MRAEKSKSRPQRGRPTTHTPLGERAYLKITLTCSEGMARVLSRALSPSSRVCKDVTVLPYLAHPKRANLRASDLERHQAVDFLRQHAGEGRLTTDELEERIEQAYGAKTLGQLAALTADLPAEPRAYPGLRRPLEVPADPNRRFRVKLLRQVRRWATLDLAAILIWFFSGRHGSFWPGYVILLGLLAVLFRVSRQLERHWFAKGSRYGALNR